MSAYTPPEGAKKQAKSEFWKPREGDTAVGILVLFADSRFGRYFTLSPVIVYPAQGSPEAYSSLSIGVKSWLDKVITMGLLHKCIALAYTGATKTPQGWMRTFDVYEIPASDWSDQRAKYLDEAALEGTEGAQQTDDDEPPF